MGVSLLTNNTTKTSFAEDFRENPPSRCWAVASKEKRHRTATKIWHVAFACSEV